MVPDTFYCPSCGTAYVVVECARCGKHFMKKARSNVRPFCSKSHQTRYSEAAHAMLDRGESVDEVAEAFPHIKRSTIERWAEKRHDKCYNTSDS